MRILLIAYEYPPVVAAQALRWHYLGNELARLGVEVHVLCPNFTGFRPYPAEDIASVVDHRVWPGPFFGLSQWLAGPMGGGVAGDEASGGRVARCAFKVYRGVRKLLDHALYPDVRSEWYPFARGALLRLLKDVRFDAVISSHEPGVDLLLGLWAKRQCGLPWVVDLADPLCAPYSPKWRRWLDKRVEAHVINKADRVILTTEDLLPALEGRHGPIAPNKVGFIPQGGPVRRMQTGTRWARPGTMHIVFTGNFYEDFRNPSQFAGALRAIASGEIAVTIAGDNARFAPMFEGIDNVTFVGRLDHFECLALQQTADVLLNLANTQSYQIPGKIYEYMTAGKTILHVRAPGDDPSERLLVSSGLGRSVANSADDIRSALENLLSDWREGSLVVAHSAVERFAAMHSWEMRARSLHEMLVGLIGSGSRLA